LRKFGRGIKSPHQNWKRGIPSPRFGEGIGNARDKQTELPKKIKMGFFSGAEAPKPPEPKGMMQIFKNPAEQLTNSLATRIANYGTAVTVSFRSVCTRWE